MSGEQLTTKDLSKTSDVQLSKSEAVLKVNINDLLARVKKDKEKEKTENYIFLGLICTVIAVTGVIASI